METTFKFLRKLKKNNDRDWFKANKKEFDASIAEVTALTEKLIEGIAAFDPEVIGIEPKSCLFRIYRDIRFSKDKSPYKTNLGASINPGGRKSSVPGYYLHIEPGNCFLAGGKHRPEGTELISIRNAIAADPKALASIEKNGTFRKYFGEIHSMEKLKTAPKGFDPDHSAIEYLRMKEFIAYHMVKDDKQVQDAKFPAYAARVFKAMTPLIGFLREAGK